MSGYYDDEASRRRSHRSSRRPVYEEEIIETRNGRPGGRQMELVRRRDSEDDVEEVRRDFVPGEGGYVSSRKYSARDKYTPARTRSVGRSGYYEEDDEYYDSRRRGGHRKSRSSRYDSDSDYDSRSPPPRHRERRKSLSEQVLGAVGLSGAAAALTGRDKDKDRDRGRERSRSVVRNRRYDSDDSRSRSRSRARSMDGRQKIQQAAKAALTAGAIEAWRSRKEPGGLAGQSKRILTAAVGAGGVNTAIDNNPDKHGTRHVIESAIGGLAGNRLINGPRQSSRSRSRSRSRGRNSRDDREHGGMGVGGMASAAALAGLAGKAFNDYRERSRARKDRRDSSASDDEQDARDFRRGQPERRKRSKSVTDFATDKIDRALAKVGLGDSENHQHKYGKDKFGRRPGLEDNSDDDYVARPRGGEMVNNGNSSDGTDSYSSDKEAQKQKKLSKKEYLTAGLATVATIHAVHGVHQSMEKRKERHKKVMEGKMAPAEARKLKSRALMQDAASVGIAALGIKGAMSEWKEVNEQRREVRKKKLRLAEMREHRRAKLSRNDSYSEPNLGDRYQESEPRYQDGNPYGAAPPPPMGGRY